MIILRFQKKNRLISHLRLLKVRGLGAVKLGIKLHFMFDVKNVKIWSRRELGLIPSKLGLIISILPKSMSSGWNARNALRNLLWGLILKIVTIFMFRELAEFSKLRIALMNLESEMIVSNKKSKKILFISLKCSKGTGKSMGTMKKHCRKCKRSKNDKHKTSIWTDYYANKWESINKNKNNTSRRKDKRIWWSHF